MIDRKKIFPLYNTILDSISDIFLPKKNLKEGSEYETHIVFDAYMRELESNYGLTIAVEYRESTMRYYAVAGRDTTISGSFHDSMIEAKYDFIVEVYEGV